MRNRFSNVRSVSQGLSESPALSELYHINTKIPIAGNASMIPAPLSDAEMVTIRGAFWRFLYAESQALSDYLPPAESPIISLLSRRRSATRIEHAPISLRDLAFLLYAAYGVVRFTTGTGPSQVRRTAPSAGGLFPIEIFCCAREVAGLEPGLYHYNPVDFAIERFAEVDWEKVSRAVPHPTLVENASLLFVLCGVLSRSSQKYGDRAYRYVLMEAGHVGQNLYLAAAERNIGVCAIGGFLDEHLETELRLNGSDEVVLSVYAIGGDG